MNPIENQSYTVLLCVDYDETVLRRYTELLRYCEIQGGTSQTVDNLYITKRNLRVTDRVIPYDLILALGGDDASDIAWRIYRTGGLIAVAFFDLKCSRSDMMPVIRSVKEVFPSLICAVAIARDASTAVTKPAELFTSPSEWLYFLNDSSPEQMEQLIAHLISSFVLHREKEIALAKNEATMEGLRQILEASPDLLKKQSELELAQLILRKLRILTGCSDTYIMTLDQKSKEPKYLAGTGAFQTDQQFQQEYARRGTFYQETLKDTKIIRMKDGVFVPLWVQGQSVGILFLNREHLLTRGTELMDIFAHHVGFALENRRLQIELEQKQAWEHELQLASRIQSSLLPKSFPDIPGLSIYGLTKSAKEIGGDYFDVIGSESSFFICIGDVSGKGVPAGLIMSELRSFVRCLALSYRSPKEILLQSAKLLLQDISGSGKFVSMLLFYWDGKVLKYSSAGHEHILHYHASTGICDAYRSGGVVLGVDFRNFSRLLQEKQLDYQPGDLVVLFTDGATEAKNAANDMFKLANLQKVVEKYHELSVKDLTEYILKDILTFVGDIEQHDDITLIAMKFQGASANPIDLTSATTIRIAVEKKSEPQEPQEQPTKTGTSPQLELTQIMSQPKLSGDTQQTEAMKVMPPSKRIGDTQQTEAMKAMPPSKRIGDTQQTEAMKAMPPSKTSGESRPIELTQMMPQAKSSGADTKQTEVTKGMPLPQPKKK